MNAIIYAFILLASINLFVLDYFVFSKPVTPSVPIPSPTSIPTPTQIAVNPSPTITPTVTLSTKPTSIPKTSKSVSYFPIPGSGSILSTKWADVSGTDFYFDTNDYPSLAESYFSASIRLFNGNGTAFVRLFDVTAGIEVWGSEVKTNSQSFTFVTSDRLTLRSGNHLYRVQAKSLTADTTVFNSGQLRLISSQ